jgi:hypothetical protein
LEEYGRKRNERRDIKKDRGTVKPRDVSLLVFVLD